MDPTNGNPSTSRAIIVINAIFIESSFFLLFFPIILFIQINMLTTELSLRNLLASEQFLMVMCSKSL